ncbi:MAG: energy transducer TonB [Desulfovibrio sp.]|uniref:energy transducer TonB n=1 Tax=Desulfovibrio sp. TaxID=885 RepID=UPI00135D1B5A|nr:energy transducer TonB [Desulfovibrio sp.]MTJ92747.1 energy transducer TonB [Desulfovibrio sp.]
MTSTERFYAALAISCLAHWGMFHLFGAASAQNSLGTPITISMDSLGLGPSPERGSGISMEAAPNRIEPPNTADKRREAFFAFLDDLDAAVHSHRMDEGEEELLGVAAYAFTVRPDGSFTDPVLRQTSGSPVLDAAAYRAVCAASGSVKRPEILGNGAIPVVLHVKYQYDLR